jgi:hypothetical protein
MMDQVRLDTCGDTVFDECALSLEDMVAGKFAPEMCRGYLVSQVARYLRSNGDGVIVQPDDDPMKMKRGELAKALLGPQEGHHRMLEVTDGEQAVSKQFPIFGFRSS